MSVRGFALLVVSVLFLTACQSQSASPDQVMTEATTVSSNSASTTATETATFAWSLQGDSSEGHATHYSLYDIDGNGVRELLTAYQLTTGQVSLAAVYYLQNGVSTYLAQSFIASGGGRRESATIYSDGTVLYYWWHAGSGDGTTTLYQINPDQSGHVILAQADFQAFQIPDLAQGRWVLDLAVLDWQSF